MYRCGLVNADLSALAVWQTLVSSLMAHLTQALTPHLDPSDLLQNLSAGTQHALTLPQHPQLPSVTSAQPILNNSAHQRTGSVPPTALLRQGASLSAEASPTALHRQMSNSNLTIDPQVGRRNSGLSPQISNSSLNGPSQTVIGSNLQQSPSLAHPQPYTLAHLQLLSSYLSTSSTGAPSSQLDLHPLFKLWLLGTKTVSRRVKTEDEALTDWNDISLDWLQTHTMSDLIVYSSKHPPPPLPPPPSLAVDADELPPELLRFGLPAWHVDISCGSHQLIAEHLPPSKLLHCASNSSKILFY